MKKHKTRDHKKAAHHPPRGSHLPADQSGLQGQPVANEPVITEAEIQLSLAVMNIARPIVNELDYSQDQKKVLTAAAYVWNVGLLHEEKHNAALWLFIDQFDIAPGEEALAEAMLRDLKVMLWRKKRFYPNDRREILDYEILPANEQVMMLLVLKFKENEEIRDAEAA